MALFEKQNSETRNMESQTMYQQQSASENEYDIYSGEGLEAISEAAKDCRMFLSARKNASGNGVWMLSGINKELGATVRVVLLDAKKVWVEKRPGDGHTVQTTEPGGIDVDTFLENGFERYTAKESGYPVLETYMYALMLVDYPEVGPVVITANPGNLKYFRSWSQQINFSFLPNGKKASPHSYIWELEIGKFKSKPTKDNPTGADYVGFSGARSCGLVEKEKYTGVVIPLVEQKNRLLIGVQAEE